MKCIMKGRVLIIGDDGDLVSFDMNSNRVCTLNTDTSLSVYYLYPKIRWSCVGSQGKLLLLS